MKNSTFYKERNITAVDMYAAVHKYAAVLAHANNVP